MPVALLLSPEAEDYHFVLALLPILVAVTFIAINPDMGELLITTTTGQIALAVGIGFELLGLWLIRRLAAIDI